MGVASKLTMLQCEESAGHCPPKRDRTDAPVLGLQLPSSYHCSSVSVEDGCVAKQQVVDLLTCKKFSLQKTFGREIALHRFRRLLFLAIYSNCRKFLQRIGSTSPPWQLS